MADPLPDAPSPLVIALTGTRLRRTLVVTVVVGTILNLINQGDALLGSGELHWPKLLLTFVVPFCVATYGAWSALSDKR